MFFTMITVNRGFFAVPAVKFSTQSTDLKTENIIWFLGVERKCAVEISTQLKACCFMYWKWTKKMLIFSPNILLRKRENFIKFSNRFKISHKVSIFWSLFGYDFWMKEATVNFCCFAIGTLNPKIFWWHFYS